MFFSALLPLALLSQVAVYASTTSSLNKYSRLVNVNLTANNHHLYVTAPPNDVSVSCILPVP